MKEHPAMIVLAIAVGLVYFAMAGVPEFHMMHGPFVGECAHGGLEYPLRCALEASGTVDWVFHSRYGEFNFFGLVGTFLYALAGALIGWIIDRLCFWRVEAS